LIEGIPISKDLKLLIIIGRAIYSSKDIYFFDGVLDYLVEKKLFSILNNIFNFISDKAILITTSR
jgi:hypothetical protein